MPIGPKGEKRPADVIGNAVRVMNIATGQESENFGVTKPINKAAAELGRKGGKKRADALTSERRSEIAKQAATERWKTKPKASDKS